MELSMKWSLFTLSEQSTMKYVGQAILSLMEQGVENYVADTVFHFPFNVFEICKAFLWLLIYMSMQNMMPIKSFSKIVSLLNSDSSRFALLILHKVVKRLEKISLDKLRRGTRACSVYHRLV